MFSSSVLTLSRPPIISWKITDRSFGYASHRLKSTSRFISSASPVLSRFTSSSTCQPILLIIPTLISHHNSTLSLQARTISTNPSHLKYFFYLFDCLHLDGTEPDLSRSSVYYLFLILIFVYSVW